MKVTAQPQQNWHLLAQALRNVPPFHLPCQLSDNSQHPTPRSWGGKVVGSTKRGRWTTQNTILHSPQEGGSLFTKL